MDNNDDLKEVMRELNQIDKNEGEYDGKSEDKNIEPKSRKTVITSIVVFIVVAIMLFFGLSFLLIVFKHVDKPIIYLYPTEETEVSVKLLKKDNITCSYPKYIDGWNVTAQPNGDLVDNETGRKLYSLYYESTNDVEFSLIDEGFVIKGKDSAEFLEEKLDLLGLTEREAEEFIVYWLPKLEANKYNYIRFATKEEINENMPLEITPTPDTIIRVLMEYKGLDKPIEVKEQQLTTPTREGFVAVEWGGTEIK